MSSPTRSPCSPTRPTCSRTPAAIALALFAARLARRPASGDFTFGFRRAEILSAQLNGATLVGLAVLIAVEAIQRLVTRQRWPASPCSLVASQASR